MVRAGAFVAALTGLAVLAGCAGQPVAPPPEGTSAGESVKLDALFIGAHPDDEASLLSTFGQWKQVGARNGVLTITRGEGGGNAVGHEEGPALGMLREGEERAAVGLAGVGEVLNLDKVDFFYTVSASLTRQVWDERDTLERVVRIVRQTRPNVLITMDPAPSPGNHGNHQLAARLAIQAYFAAADPAAFPGQITGEGLKPYAPAKILRNGLTGSESTAPTGPACASAVLPAGPNQQVFGVWSGASAPDGRTWAAVERDAQRRYVTQGWAVLPDVPTGPARLGCDWFTQLHSRVPYPAPGTPAADLPTAILTGTGPDVPRTPGTWVPPGRTLEVGQQRLPQVAEFDEWAERAGMPWLRGSVPPVLTVPSGGSREVAMTVTNRSDVVQTGTVTVAPPAGFAVDAREKPFAAIAPGRSTAVPFTFTSTDPALPTANQGGDHPYQLSARTQTGLTAAERPALELAPATSVPAVPAAPVIDGVAAPGEYPGAPLDLSRRWEGDQPCDGPADCSGTARLSRSGETLNVFAEVRDSVRGAALATADCKRHWRTDSLEIALDPSGTSENTATTMKLAVLPFTAGGPACAERDADNHQGPASQTAPGVRFASTPVPGGYTVEVAIPLAALPGPVDPARLGLNLLVYDSDTPDQTGQTRIGWSTWPGVQGDPYRWGVAALPGYQPPGGARAARPVIPSEALASRESPRSVEQALTVRMPLSGGPSTPPGASGWLTSADKDDNAVEVRFASSGRGVLSVLLRDADGTAGSATTSVDGPGEHRLTVDLHRPLAADARAVAVWLAGPGNLVSQAKID